jgi:hypothetical protein
MQNNDQKGSLKNTFSDFGAAPTDGLWNAISEKLDDKKKRRFVFWWWSAGLAAVLVVGFAVWDMNQPSAADKLAGGRSYPVHAETNAEETNTPKGGIALAAVDSLHLHAPFALIWDPSMFPFNFDISHYYPFSCGTADWYYQPFLGCNQVQLPNYNQEKSDSLKNAQMLLAKADSMAMAMADTITSGDDPAVALRIAPPKKWQIGLFAGRSQAFAQSNPLTDSLVGNAIPSMNANPTFETRYSWDVDLTVSKRIFSRWWLGTGVHFGVLGSVATSETTVIKSGKVNYTTIGIPLSIGREFRIGRRFHITPMVGFRYDYAFRKTEEYTYKEPDVSISWADAPPTYVKTTETAKLNLFSTSISAELALRLHRNWNIVAKPTTQFYLYGKTDETYPNTFRKAWFGGSIGVTKRF